MKLKNRRQSKNISKGKSLDRRTREAIHISDSVVGAKQHPKALVEAIRDKPAPTQNDLNKTRKKIKLEQSYNTARDLAKIPVKDRTYGEKMIKAGLKRTRADIAK